MRYALVRDDGSVAGVAGNLSSPDMWTHPEGFYVVEAEGFDPDPQYNLSDYTYKDGVFALDEAGIAEREQNRPFDPGEVLAALLQETDALDALPDGTLAHMAPYMAEWQEGQSYWAGDKCQWLDLPYRCLQPHTSQVGWEPSNAPSLWARILGGQDGQVAEWEQPDSTNPYMAGDKVTHNGHTWESEVDNNVWEPGVYGWKQLD